MRTATPTKIIVGTRTSDLALWQTNHIIAQLEAAWPGLHCERQPFVTKGDRTQAAGQALPAIGGKGLFTAELEHALRSGEIDIAVHSLKDLPVENSPGLTIGAIPARADVRDVLVARDGLTLATLPPGAVVGTSSTRRAAQLLAHRPDLTIRTIRGNVPTRIRKVHDGDYDATLLAAAGLLRLGLQDAVTEFLPLTLMLPAPGQGALAVQCRADDAATLALLAALDDAVVRAAVSAERTFLHALGGGCSAPVAAYAAPDATGNLQLTALVGSTDGTTLLRVTAANGQSSSSPEELGLAAATDALAQGAAHLLNPGGDAVTNAAAPLRGKRIVITRAAAQAASFADALAALGATPILVPTIRIEPLPDLTALDTALRQLDQYDWLIVTSANGVEILADRLTALRIAPAAWATTKVAAIGSATADALRAHGIIADFVPEQYVADAIVAGLADVAGQRILLPQAEIARETLATQLAARGAVVDAIPIYQTLTADLDGVALTALGEGVDVITFTSSSTVQNLVAAVGAATAATPTFAQSAIACIGPVTAATARELGLQVAIEAEEQTVPGLVTAIVDYFQSSS
jgi:hydroxymethylbilane synthase